MGKSAAPGGRPRHSGTVADDPREEIIAAAAALFADKGLSATRMTEISEASGLRPASIYYWFHSKDEILRAIMDQNRVSLLAARALADRDEPAAVRLYIVLYQDVIQMCSAPLNFYDLEEAAHHQPDTFDDFHADYEELSGRLQKMVDDGMSTGEFCAVSSREFVRTALCLNEGSQYRFHAQRRDQADMHEYACWAAQVSVRVLLKDTAALPGVRAAAREGILGFRTRSDD